LAATQLHLFEVTTKTYHQTVSFPSRTVDIGDVTFLDGQKEPVHRWFRLTPSYSPALVRFLMDHLDCSRTTLILDPFLGKGTTLIETKRHGLPAIGIELNPLLKLAAEYALTWEVNRAEFEAFARSQLSRMRAALAQHHRKSLEEVVASYSLRLPAIHNVFRWWRPQVLKDLLLVRREVFSIEAAAYRQLFWLALAACALDCANVHRNHPTITFDDDHTRQIDVLRDFEEKIQRMVADLRGLALSSADFGQTSVILGDSVHLADYVSQVDRVVTSPPYPNRFSYVHTTRPQLFFMEIFNAAHRSADLDCQAIGGTWGRATSELYTAHLEPEAAIASILQPLSLELRQRSQLMHNYAVKYFNMLYAHIESLRSVARRPFRGAYVVGNSRLSGVEVHTDALLAKIFEQCGFKVDEILILRKRGGRKKLFETAVCISL
jgi:hypothetical protein